jgi:purine catabolism regulator
MEHGFSVQELLDTKYLRCIAKVVAGQAGLSKNVSWVHILEIRDIIQQCVNGNELVFTTGIGFTTKDIAIEFVEKLIEQGVSALCIETALYYHQIDQELIDLANEKNFPLIEIPEISRFIDITKGLNTMLINEDSKLLQDADFYENQFCEIKSKGTIADGIRYTANYLNVEIAYFPFSGKQYGFCTELRDYINSKMEILNQMLVHDEIYICGNVAINQLKIFEKNWGYLIFKHIDREISQFELLILNRLANKLKSDIYAELFEREEKLYKDNFWIKQWLNGNLNEKILQEKLRELGFQGQYKEYFVCCTSICSTNLSIDRESQEDLAAMKDEVYFSFNDFLLQTTVIVKRIFNDAEFTVVGYMENKIISYIVLVPENIENTWDRLESCLNQLRQGMNQVADFKNCGFFVGKKVNTVTELKRSRDTAMELLFSDKCQGGRVLIFDKLFINRIMRPLKELFVLDDFVTDHLGMLLKPENAELLHTLRLYFECSCSKQKTAEKLFIVRQTLYFRLEKIQDILGDDFAEGERRFALEFAVHAYFYEQSLQQSARESK